MVHTKTGAFSFFGWSQELSKHKAEEIQILADHKLVLGPGLTKLLTPVIKCSITTESFLMLMKHFI